MGALAELTSHFQVGRARPWVEALISIGVGIVSFAVAFFILAYFETREVADQAQTPAEADGLSRAPQSPAGRIAADKVAVGVPSSAQEMLLAEAKPGDRLDVIALLGGRPGVPSRTAVVVSGATVLSPPSSGQGSPALLEVSPEEAVVLGHLIQGGVRLTYALWSSSGSPAPAQPLDVADARARLGLAP
jgi:hypothetical protein